MKKPRKNPIKEIEQRLAASNLLSEEEKDDLLKKAKAQIYAKRKKQAEDDFLDAAIEEELRVDRPDEQFVDVTIDVPQFAAFIRLDNVLYFHGILYSVPLSVAQVMLETMHCAWRHDAETQRGDDKTRRARNLSLSPSQQNVPANNITDLRQLGMQRI